MFDLTWNQVNDTIFITSVQTASSFTSLFKTPFDVRIISLKGDILVRLIQDSNQEKFKLYYPETVDSIEFDPENWLIQKSSIHLGIEEISNSVSFIIIPNPAKDKITVEVKQETIVKNTLISIYNIQGQLLLQQQLKAEKTELDISGLAKGVYLIKLKSFAKSEVSRFVKE